MSNNLDLSVRFYRIFFFEKLEFEMIEKFCLNEILLI